MSYSRWSNSSWYVFWESSTSGDLKENQQLACWYDLSDEHMISWSYTQVDELLQKSPDVIINHIQIRYNCSPDEANELQDWMQEWRSDVRKEYT
jgi:hypothetical protein